ncbi:MAG: TrgA family protein, partial [Paracoccaceae bacterium]
RSIGPEIGRGYKVSGNVGLRGAIILLVAALLVFSFEHMLVLALRRTYDGPMEALVDIVSIAIDYLQQIMLPDILIVLLGGGILTGWLAEWASHRWR